MMIRKDLVAFLRIRHYDIFCSVYEAARELRTDLCCIFNTHAFPEERYVATCSIHDDIKAFMQQMKKANYVCREELGCYITKYDDYLHTRGGQYALAKEMIKIMDDVSFEANHVEIKTKGTKGA